MYISMCLYIITIKLWVLSIYSFIKHYIITILCSAYNLVICVCMNEQTMMLFEWFGSIRLCKPAKCELPDPLTVALLNELQCHMGAILISKT